MDAFATPFVQGRLRNEQLTVTVHTECAHCKKPMELTIDSELNYSAAGKGCEPVVYAPDLDLFTLPEKNIIKAF